MRSVSITAPVRQSVCLPACLPACLSVCPFFRLSICPGHDFAAKQGMILLPCIAVASHSWLQVVRSTSFLLSQTQFNSPHHSAILLLRWHGSLLILLPDLAGLVHGKLHQVCYRLQVPYMPQQSAILITAAVIILSSCRIVASHGMWKTTLPSSQPSDPSTPTCASSPTVTWQITPLQTCLTGTCTRTPRTCLTAVMTSTACPTFRTSRSLHQSLGLCLTPRAPPSPFQAMPG